MKTLLSLLLASLLTFCINTSYSQESCKVLKPEIAVKYEGQCKKGLAHGKGKAEGIDKYEGNFKKGLPHGMGVYTWSTGEIYDGNWQEGKKEGLGKLFYKKDGADSVKIGIWKNDVYYKKNIGRSYKIITARDLDRYSVRRVGDGNEVSIEFFKMGRTNADISDLQIIADNGLYKSVSRKFIYYQLIFPVTIKITYTTTNKTGTQQLNVYFEVTISDAGIWEISLTN